MFKTLKEIIKATPENSHFYLLDSDLTYPQPDPETDENFIEDYQANADNYNLYALLKRGNQSLDIDEDLYEMLDSDNIAAYTMALAEAITDTHLNAWARLYYALSLAYNPLYNVDGTTTRTTSEKVRTDSYGAQSGGNTVGATDASDIFGNRSETLGQHTDTQTEYAVSFDASAEKETGSVSNNIAQQTNTQASYTDRHTSVARNDTHSESAHEDTHTDDEFTETEVRKGNIGVTMSQQLLEAEWNLRKKDFFATIINQMLDELGFMYIGGIEA